jgi:enoyl-CoA hydratase/carnithine racemase
LNETISTDIADRVLTIRLNRPAKRNALTIDMYLRLVEILDLARDDSGVRAVLLAGSPSCFTSGNDLIEGKVEGPDGAHGQFMKALMDFTKPVIAAPCGIAVGIGVTMLLHCDLVYCGAETMFRLPFVPLAVCPEFGSSVLLPRLVGHHRASELLLTGEPFDAATAREFGMVNDILPNDQVEEFARAKATFIAAQPPTSVRTTKVLLKRALTAEMSEAIAAEFDCVMKLKDGTEAREAVAAFQEKRRVDFSRFS